MRGLWKRLTLLLVSVGVAFVLAELGVRALLAVRSARQFARLRAGEATVRVDSDNLGDIIRMSGAPDVIYELKPGIRGSFRGGKLSTNEFGMRGGSLTIEKPAGTRRIVGLGDSFMFGQAVSDEDTYLERLREALAAGGEKIETLNFAVPGYNTVMEAAVLETSARRFSPNLIVVGVIGNDWDLPDFLLNGPGKSTSRSALLELLGDVAFKYRSRKLVPTPASRGDSLRFLNAPDEVPPEYRHMVGYDGFLRGLDRIHRVSAELGAEVVLFSDCLNPEGFGCGWPGKGVDQRAFWDDAARWGFSVCQWRLTADQLIPREGHPSPPGHRALARQLERCLSPQHAQASCKAGKLSLDFHWKALSPAAQWLEIGRSSREVTGDSAVVEDLPPVSGGYFWRVKAKVNDEWLPTAWRHLAAPACAAQ